MGSPILGSSHIFLFAHDNFTQSSEYNRNYAKSHGMALEM